MMTTTDTTTTVRVRTTLDRKYMFPGADLTNPVTVSWGDLGRVGATDPDTLYLASEDLSHAILIDSIVSIETL